MPISPTYLFNNKKIYEPCSLQIITLQISLGFSGVYVNEKYK